MKRNVNICCKLCEHAVILLFAVHKSRKFHISIGSFSFEVNNDKYWVGIDGDGLFLIYVFLRLVNNSCILVFLTIYFVMVCIKLRQVARSCVRLRQGVTSCIKVHNFGQVVSKGGKRKPKEAKGAKRSQKEQTGAKRSQRES